MAYARAAPWCGHCKALAPKYEKAATRMAIKGQSRIFAKCDATESTVAKNKYEITGFPSLMLFKHGKHIADYSGQREVEPLVAYIEKCARARHTRARARTGRQNGGTPPPPLPPAVCQRSSMLAALLFVRVHFHRQLARIDEPEEEVPKSAVLELHEENFEDMLVEHETILVQFKAAWCPISQKMSEAWEKAATMLLDNEKSAKLATINAPVRAYPFSAHLLAGRAC